MQSKGQGNGGGFVEVARKGRMARLSFVHPGPWQPCLVLMFS